MQERNSAETGVHRTFWRFGLTLTLSAALSCSAVAANSLVANGGFATLDFTGWTVTPAASLSNIVVDDPTLCGLGAPSTNLGGTRTNAALFGALGTFDDTISQTFATTPGATYQISFELAMSSQIPSDFSASFGSIQMLNLNAAGDAKFHQLTFTELASSATTTLSFSSLNVRMWNGLTNISVVPVPEPNTYVLMLAGLALIGTVARRKSAT